MSYLQRVKSKEREWVADVTAAIKTSSNNPLQKLRQKVLPSMDGFLKTLNVTEPFDPSWAKFFKLAGPEIMTWLLWDLGVITQHDDIPVAKRFFRTHIKG